MSHRRRPNIERVARYNFLYYSGRWRIGNIDRTQGVYNSDGQFICLYDKLPSVSYMMRFNNKCEQTPLKERTPEFLKKTHKEVETLELQNQYLEAGGLILRQLPHSRSTWGVYKDHLFVHTDTDYPTHSQKLAFVKMDPSEREKVIAALISANGDEPTSDTMHLLCLPYWEKENRREEKWWDAHIYVRMAFLNFEEKF